MKSLTKQMYLCLKIVLKCKSFQSLGAEAAKAQLSRINIVRVLKMQMRQQYSVVRSQSVS